MRQLEAERADRLAVVGPPPALKLSSLVEAPPKKKRKTIAAPLRRGAIRASTEPPTSSSSTPLTDAVQPAIAAARAQHPKLAAALQPPPGLADLRLSPALRVFCSAAAVAKHRRTVTYLFHKGCVTAKPAEATHKVFAGKADEAYAARGAGWCSMSDLLQELRLPAVRTVAGLRRRDTCQAVDGARHCKVFRCRLARRLPLAAA